MQTLGEMACVFIARHAFQSRLFQGKEIQELLDMASIAYSKESRRPLLALVLKTTLLLTQLPSLRRAVDTEGWTSEYKEWSARQPVTDNSDKESTSPHPVGYVPDWPPKSKKPPRGTDSRTVYTKYDIQGTFVSSDVRKSHGPRVPILFTPLSRDITFRDVSSQDIRNELADSADEMPPYRKITRNGCLATSVRTGDAASRLLELTSLAGVLCRVTIPRWYSGNVRKIFGVPVRYSERQLLEHFYAIGVIHVRRQVKHVRAPDGSPQRSSAARYRPILPTQRPTPGAGLARLGVVRTAALHGVADPVRQVPAVLPHRAQLQRTRPLQVVRRPSTTTELALVLRTKYIGRSLEEIAGERLSNAFFSNRGCLTAYVTSTSAFRRLRAITSLSGVPVKADFPRWFHKNAGKLKDVPERYTEKNLMNRLHDLGAINVRRQVNHIQLPDGGVQVKPTNQVVVHFGPDRVVPAQVKLGFSLHQVHPYVPPPVQCTRCQEMHHVAKSCPNETRCKVCAGPHTYKLCTAKKGRLMRCANCGGGHTATYARCPAKMREVRRLYRERLAEINRQRARLRELDEQREAEEMENSSQYSRYFVFD
ncbi:hypothetical protein MTO96_037487 [Rhipicephalus appendiculatus]